MADLNDQQAAQTVKLVGANASAVEDNFVEVDASGALSTKVKQASTTTTTSVASSTSNVTLLAANTARLGATIYNDSTSVLYLKLGATASTTSYTVQMIAASYYETPYGYTGQIDGIWASAAGAAVIGELA